MNDYQKEINDLHNEIGNVRLKTSEVIKNYADTEKLHSERILNIVKSKLYITVSVVIPIIISALAVVVAILKT